MKEENKQKLFSLFQFFNCIKFMIRKNNIFLFIYEFKILKSKFLTKIPPKKLRIKNLYFDFIIFENRNENHHFNKFPNYIKI